MLVAYTNALQIIRTLRPIVEQLKTYDANAADQVVRAATSITHNVADARADRARTRSGSIGWPPVAHPRSWLHSTPRRHGAGGSTLRKFGPWSIASSACCGAFAADPHEGCGWSRCYMIAAIAKSRGLTVVTSNIDELRRVPELTVEDWRTA